MTAVRDAVTAAREAIVLSGHGSRSPEANESLLALARTLGDELGVPVFPGYLEMAEPTIPAALRAARDAGAERLVLLPFFLSPGMHVRRDLEAIAAVARAELGVPIDVTDFLGAHPAIPTLLAEIAGFALERSA